MPVRKIKNSWWVDFRINRQRYRKHSPENTHAGAQAFEALCRRRVINGEPLEGHKVNQESIPFADFAQSWFENYVIANNKPSEQYSKSIYLRKHLIPFFGKKDLKEITMEPIEQYKAKKRNEGLSSKTINLHLTTLAKCLRCAFEWGKIERLPRIDKLKTPTPVMDFLTPVESESLLNYLYRNDPNWYPVILTALRTGMRRGELFGLQWKDVDLTHHKIVVCGSLVRGKLSSPKNYRTRYIPISPELFNVLSNMSPKRGFVFGHTSDTPMSTSVAHRHLSIVCTKAGLRQMQWHAFRHTFASQLVSTGIPLNVVRDLLGHSDIKMTMRYSHFAPSLYDRAVDQLDLLGKQAPLEDFGQPVGNRAQIAPPPPQTLTPQIYLGCQQKSTTV